ncbi:thioredoxin family protein [Lutibacter sp. A64]|uniref:thioredoxin family protein n=1 Tax=Lutibacter sp. A64 TaxID=2918526 RepID=UPI001F0584EA|nr:thioredoxin family protein [Lutibacter sp. A64]UMB52792.1 thioredoxin family protein [Lutibacter sp. A64]
MKKLILIICILVLNFSCGNKKNITSTKMPTPTTETPSIATLNANGDLIGLAAKSDFLKAPFNDWFQFNSENYELNTETIEALKPLLKDVTIKAFMGTWCGDSQEQTPVFYKILDATNFNYKNLKLVALDRSKKTPDNLQEGFNIVRVPTFIFYRNGEEIGRFVEYPRETVEEDMFKIVSGAGYKHSYQD